MCHCARLRRCCTHSRSTVDAGLRPLRMLLPPPLVTAAVTLPLPPPLWGRPLCGRLLRLLCEPAASSGRPLSAFAVAPADAALTESCAVCGVPLCRPPECVVPSAPPLLDLSPCSLPAPGKIATAAAAAAGDGADDTRKSPACVDACGGDAAGAAAGVSGDAKLLRTMSCSVGARETGVAAAAVVAAVAVAEASLISRPPAALKLRAAAASAGDSCPATLPGLAPPCQSPSCGNSAAIADIACSTSAGLARLQRGSET